MMPRAFTIHTLRRAYVRVLSESTRVLFGFVGADVTFAVNVNRRR